MLEFENQDGLPSVDDQHDAAVRSPYRPYLQNSGNPPLVADPTVDAGQALYHLAMGAQPDDFHPSIQPMAQSFSRVTQAPQPQLGPGVLGSREDIRRWAAAGQDAIEGEVPILQDIASSIRQRDVDYLDRYYDAVAAYAKQYRVNPAFPLGLGMESTFASGGTYLDTGDAFGMTGGSKAHMTRASSPQENARQLFNKYGPQMYGAGDDAEAFINGMQGRDSQGRPVAGWRVYNSEKPKDWEAMARSGIQQMQRDLPLYLPTRGSKAKAAP